MTELGVDAAEAVDADDEQRERGLSGRLSALAQRAAENALEPIVVRQARYRVMLGEPADPLVSGGEAPTRPQ